MLLLGSLTDWRSEQAASSVTVVRATIHRLKPMLHLLVNCVCHHLPAVRCLEDGLTHGRSLMIGGRSSEVPASRRFNERRMCAALNDSNRNARFMGEC